MCIDCHRRITAIVGMALSEGRFLPTHLAADARVLAAVADAPEITANDRQLCFTLSSALTLCMPDPGTPLPFLKIEVSGEDSTEFMDTFTLPEARAAQMMAKYLANQFEVVSQVLNQMLADNRARAEKLAAELIGKSEEPAAATDVTPIAPVMEFPRPRGAKPPVS